MPELLVGNALRATARKLPHKTAFIFKDRRCTYREFEERVNLIISGGENIYPTEIRSRYWEGREAQI